MAKDNSTFHESWHRIAKQRIMLRLSVQVQRQFFRGKKWFVLHDPFSNNYYRLRPETYQFIARLNKSRTITEVWEECMDTDPDNTPGQGDIIELLAQLYHANLLHSDLAPDSTKLFERYKKRKQRLIQANLMNIMFFRIPLFDPDDILKLLQPLIKILLSPVSAILWIGIVGGAIKVAIDNFSALQVQSDGILAPSNLPLLYLGLVFIKTFHEFGHAFMVRRFGGEVHTMGVMFLIFNPLPYMDATSAWFFRNKWQRVLVGAAGMIFEIFFAACALFIWAHTGPGVLHSLAYNMLFIASVSTVLFNINPLLRFDGYYILSDLLDFPNLHQQSRKHLTWLVEHFVFGCKDSTTPASSRNEAFWLTTFGILSGVYRVVVFTTILLFVADRFLLAGIIMMVICIITWVIIPIGKLFKYLASNPRLFRTRPRAITACIIAALILFNFLHLVPFPYNFKAPGVLKAVEYIIASNKTAGKIMNVPVSSGIKVQCGDTLMILHNKELLTKIREAEEALIESEAMYHKAIYEDLGDLKSITSRIDFYQKRLKRLDKEKSDLTILSDINGLWVAPQVEDYEGMWLPRGTPLGQLINTDTFTFVSVVSQQDASLLFSDNVVNAELKLAGQSNQTINIEKVKKIPMEQTKLPSSALGIQGGGTIAVDVTDQSGVKTKEPFYEVRAKIINNKNVSLLHGRSGFIRFSMPAKPLSIQLWLKLRQVIQKRYQI